MHLFILSLLPAWLGRVESSVWMFIDIYIYIYIYIYVCIYIYIYVVRERCILRRLLPAWPGGVESSVRIYICMCRERDVYRVIDIYR